MTLKHVGLYPDNNIVFSDTDANVATDEKVFELTPKGMLGCLLFPRYNMDEVDALWAALQDRCMKRLYRDGLKAEYAGIVFNGNGGDVIGLDFPKEEGKNCE